MLSSIKLLATSDNKWIMLSAYSLPIINIIIRNMKENDHIKKMLTAPPDQFKTLIEQRNRFRNLFLVGVLNQTLVASACLALALPILFPPVTVAAGLLLTGFTVFGSSAAVSLPAHFYLGGFNITVMKDHKI